MRITKIRHELTDGSRVFNLAIEAHGQTIELSCITQADADHLAEKLGAAIEMHALCDPITYADVERTTADAAEEMLDNFNWVGSRHHY